MRRRVRSKWRRFGRFLPMALLASTVAYATAQGAGDPGKEPGHNVPGESLWLGANVPFLDVDQSWRWLRGLSVTGYGLTTSGMWANSSSLTNFGRAAGEHHGANS